MKQVRAEPPPSVALATAWRSGRAESFHRGTVAIAWSSGRQQTLGDARAPVFVRSAIKPLQALPLLELGVAERAGFSDAELAIICASHNGTDDHVAAARGLLQRGGFAEEHLLCGPHAPFDRAAAAALVRERREPTRLHNNCSGKHTGFLWLARELGAPLASYADADGEVQQLIRRTVAEMAGLPAAEIDAGLDGCGAPALRLPLPGLARAFCRLANPNDLAAVRAAACDRLLQAVSRQPVLLAGRGRLCTALIESAPGRVLPKNGAEGVYALGVRGVAGEGFGIAIKVSDGEQRGYLPVIVELLAHLGLWPAVPSALADFQRPPIVNTQGRHVGEVTSAFDLAAVDATGEGEVTCVE